MPYALRNHTGCTLWFATLTTTPTRWVTEQTRTFSSLPRHPRTAFVFLEGSLRGYSVCSQSFWLT